MLIVPGVGAWAAASWYQAATYGFLSGGIATGNLRSAVVGAISGAAFQQIGSYFNNASKAHLAQIDRVASDGYGALAGMMADNLHSFGGLALTGSQIAGQITAHAVAGGVVSVISGGRFGHGFISAGIGAAVSGRFGQGPYAQVIGSAIVGGTISAVTGGKFANGAVSAAFATALRDDWDNNPVPKGSNIAFVGGAADDNLLGAKVVKNAYLEHIRTYGEDSAAYFEWTEHEKLATWIDQANGRATVIAHSYGADMAAQVIANGHAAYRLVTVDPVGWIRPNMSLVAANTKIWQNYDAGDSWKSLDNIIATIGGAWNSAPHGYATEHKRYKNLDHVEICFYFCKY